MIDRSVPLNQRPEPTCWQDALPDWMWERGAAEKVPPPGSLIRIKFSSDVEYGIIAGEPTFRMLTDHYATIWLKMFLSDMGQFELHLNSWFDREKKDFKWIVLERLS